MDTELSPTDPGAPRFVAVSRRAFLARGATAATAVAMLGLAACTSSDDGDVLADQAGDNDSAAGTGAGAATTDDAASAAGDGGGLVGELAIAFAYTPSGGGRVENPYLAVWVEDADGELVDTVALWFKNTRKGQRYLKDLRRWASVDGSDSTIETLSGATRTPGDYTLAWDLTDLEGNPVAPGSYYVCIESAREHGPYSLIRQPLDLGNEPLQLTLDAQGELSDADVDYQPA